MALTLRGNGQISSDNYTIDSDGGVTAVNAAVSGTLGVTGTTSMAGNLNINAQSSKINAANNHLILHDTAEADTGANHWYMYRNGGDGKLRFFKESDKLTLDSVGRLGVPNQPHMLAQGYKERYGTTDRHLFHTVTTNTGNHWNNVNGKFTCPVAGTYLVTAFSGYKQTDDYAGIGIGYNGSLLSMGWSHPTDDRHGHQNVTIMKNASANDYFYYYAQTSYTTPISSSGNDYHSHFSVYLLG